MQQIVGGVKANDQSGATEGLNLPHIGIKCRESGSRCKLQSRKAQASHEQAHRVIFPRKSFQKNWRPRYMCFDLH